MSALEVREMGLHGDDDSFFETSSPSAGDLLGTRFTPGAVLSVTICPKRSSSTFLQI